MIFDFYIENETAAAWYGLSNRQTPERDWCFDQIKRGWTIIDCGAHHGMMTVFFSRCIGSAGRVIAYEALPSNAAVIAKNVSLNHCTNVTVRPVGVGDRAGKFWVDYNASNTVVLEDAKYNDGRQVEIVRLDDDLSVNLHVNFIKIDVEGYELEALRGMCRILRQRPFLDLEIHNFLFRDRSASLRAIRETLAPLGYNFQILPEPSDQPSALIEEFDAAYLAQFDNPHLFCLPS